MCGKKRGLKRKKEVEGCSEKCIVREGAGEGEGKDEGKRGCGEERMRGGKNRSREGKI